jgi:hypothetical protein
MLSSPGTRTDKTKENDMLTIHPKDELLGMTLCASTEAPPEPEPEPDPNPPSPVPDPEIREPPDHQG